MDGTFWKGRRVLLTGHTGFKGSWLTFLLQRMGARVHGLALDPPTSPSLYDTAAMGELVEADHRADVRDTDRVMSVVDETKPDFIFHLAAQTIVKDGMRNPVPTFETNVLGTVNVMEAVRTADQAISCVIVTSDKCYAPGPEGASHSETSALGGDDPYSASKAAAELVIHAYRQTYLNERGPARRVASARAGNVIGGGDWGADRLIPDFVRAARAGIPLAVRNPLAVRPWQHVLDPLQGYLLLAERLQEDRSLETAWNFGPADSRRVTVGDLADDMVRLWGGDARWIQDPREHPSETMSLTLDPSRAISRLGWRPRLGLQEGLRWTMEMYREATDVEHTRHMMEGQIGRYGALP